jgi:hypothetical protein
MVTTITSVPIAVSVSDVAKALPLRQRRITPERGRALEKLGHAIEYLVDEQFHEGFPTQTSDHPEAVQLLMELRRKVYMEAPEIVSLGERVRLLLSALLS